MYMPERPFYFSAGHTWKITESPNISCSEVFETGRRGGDAKRTEGMDVSEGMVIEFLVGHLGGGGGGRSCFHPHSVGDVADGLGMKDQEGLPAASTTMSSSDWS